MEKSESEGKPRKGRKKKEPAERKPNWKEYTATVEDIQNFLMDRVLLRHNVITRRVECRWPTPDPFQRKGSIESPSPGEGLGWAPITDRVVNTLWSELSATKVVRAQDVYRVIESDFVPDFNPSPERGGEDDTDTDVTDVF